MKIQLSENQKSVVDAIGKEACKLHASVNQHYGKGLPYGYHLCHVAEAAIQFGGELVAEEDVIPVIFAAYFHDSIEDARQTYHDVIRIAEKYMSAEQAQLAAEIVYALTNDKGRTRAERAGERYYAGIRETPYAPFVKLCDRYANLHFSYENADPMLDIYRKEWAHFIAAIHADSADRRFALPEEMVRELEELVK